MTTTVAELPPDHLRQALLTSSLRVELGPLVVRFGLPDGEFIETFRTLYAHHPVVASDAVPDFTFTIRPAGAGLRRRAPHGVVLLDGVALTKPFEWRYAWPMFEWGLHAAVAQRGGFALMLHAAVVARDGRALVLPARSGSGKSTLCALLVAAGWTFLSDEFLVVTREDDAVRVHPLPQPIALKGASLEVVAPHYPVEEWSATWPHASKGSIRYLRPPGGGDRDPVAPGWIVLPRFVAGQGTALRPLPRRDGFLAVGPHAFTYHWRGADGFRDAVALARASECAALTFGDGSAAVAAIDAWTRPA